MILITNSSTGLIGQQILERIVPNINSLNSFLHQHVERPTRRRGDDEPSKLDLIFTNEEMQVNEVKHISPLDKSDHDVLSFEFQCYVEYSKSKERYNFSKGNYTSMRERLSEVD